MVGREPAGEVDVGREWEEASGGTWTLNGRPEACGQPSALWTLHII